MSAHIKFNDEEVLKTCGLVNTGSICYLNSFIQSLMSCTALTKFFMDNAEKFISTNNIVAIEYIKLLKTLKTTDIDDGVYNPVGIFNAIVAVTKKKYPNKQFGAGQEDSGEGLHLFLDAIDDKELYSLFMYKYLVRTWCISCVEIISEKKDESCILSMPPNFSNMHLEVGNDKSNLFNEHIRQNVSVLTDYKCSKCQSQKCCRIYQLARAPPIIVVMFNKYVRKSKVEFTPNIKFPSVDGFLNYRLVATIEHSGGTGGGHYWSNCFREGPGSLKKMYSLNDRTISRGSEEPTVNSYIVFYHNC